MTCETFSKSNDTYIMLTLAYYILAITTSTLSLFLKLCILMFTSNKAPAQNLLSKFTSNSTHQRNAPLHGVLC